MITFLSILGILLSLVVFGMTLAHQRFLNVTNELVEVERARTREARYLVEKKRWELDEANRCIYLLVEKYNAAHPTEVVKHTVAPSGVAYLEFKARKDAPYRREG